MIKFYQAWFKDYIINMRKRVPETDKPVLDEFDMKVEHTWLVQARSEEIARWLDLSEADYNIASLCGLFHDLGRFEQAVAYGTMDDRVTGSHADLSEKIFINEVPKAHLTDEEIDLIATALRCHNLLAIPGDMTVKKLMFAKLIRDADKLDIFRHHLDLHNGKEQRIFRFVQYDTQGGPNPALLEAVLHGENFDAALVQNRADRILLEISMIFDFNFGYSFQQIKAMDFLAQYTENAGSQLQTAAAYTAEYISQHLEQR